VIGQHDLLARRSQIEILAPLERLIRIPLGLSIAVDHRLFRHHLNLLQNTSPLLRRLSALQGLFPPCRIILGVTRPRLLDLLGPLGVKDSGPALGGGQYLRP
jgi:hypothetical protein